MCNIVEQKIKQNCIYNGVNIREFRKQRKIGQKELVELLELEGIKITRETLVKNTYMKNS